MSAQLLITSRYDLAREVDALAVEIAELTLEGALALLGKWTGRDQRELDALPADEICVRVDRLALGVAMAGAMIGLGPAERWRDVLGRLEAADRITARYSSTQRREPGRGLSR